LIKLTHFELLESKANKRLAISIYIKLNLNEVSIGIQKPGIGKTILG
jgi:DNA segregation ATPase FtsK/SpoIIIE-like protein